MPAEQKKPLLWNYQLADDVFYVDKNLLAKRFPLRFFRLTDLSLQLITDLTRGWVPSPGSLAKTEQFAEYLAAQGVLVRGINPVVADELPTISVVITVKNRPGEIDSCLHSIKKSDYPAEKLEVIVIDGSTDGETTAVIQRHGVKLIKPEPDPGLSACRNLGVKAASGDVIAFTDSDCEVNESWLLTLSACFRQQKTAFVGGGVLTKNPRSMIDQYETIRSPLFMGDRIEPVQKEGSVPYVPTCNLLIRRSVFEKLGGFNEQLSVGEDVDLIWRALEKGHKGWYVPGGFVWHHHRNKMPPFLRRRAQYAGSEALLNKHGHIVNKYLNIPRWHIPLLLAIFASLYLGSAAVFAIVVPLMLLIELLSKSSKLKGKGINIKLNVLARSILQSYRSTLKYFSALLTRYYLWLLLLTALITWSLGGWVLLFIPLISLMIEFPARNKHSLVLFFPLYLLEMFFYSLGFWSGCLRSGQLKLLLLKVYFR